MLTEKERLLLALQEQQQRAQQLQLLRERQERQQLIATMQGTNGLRGADANLIQGSFLDATALIEAERNLALRGAAVTMGNNNLAAAVAVAPSVASVRQPSNGHPPSATALRLENLAYSPLPPQAPPPAEIPPPLLATADDGLNGQREALGELQGHLRLIADYEKADYLTALQMAPLLVLAESDPVRFLRFYNFNAAAATRGIVNYWRRRREIFNDRAFLPMTITGDGAMNERDIAFIKTGQMVFLPHDKDGRTVLCVDPSRRLDHSADRRLRVYFYVGHILSENDKSQTQGYVSLFLMCELSFRRYDAAAGEGVALLRDTFPIRMYRHHFFNSLPAWNNHGMLFQGLITALIRLVQGTLEGIKTYSHLTQDKSKLLETMLSHDMDRDGVLRRLGGNWCYEKDFGRWIMDRQQMEREKYPASMFLQGGMPSSAPTRLAEEGNAQPLVPVGEETSTDSIPIEEYCSQLSDALRQLPDEEKVAYTEASESAPEEVWKKECNPLAFFRAEYAHPWLAAKRLTKYWTMKFRTFGPKRFELLSQTGEDSLRRNELALLGTGFVVILPNDDSGCPVLWIDGARLPGDCSRESRDRCLFYMFSLLIENPMAQKEGAVLIYRMDSPPFDTIDVTFLKDLAESLPLRFKDVHLVSREPIQIPPRSPINFGDNIYTHCSPSKDELRRKLNEHCLKDAGLPSALNGDWTYSNFVQWQEFRTRMEWRIPIGMSGKDKKDSSADKVDAFSFPTMKPYQLLPSNEQVERKRRLTVIHSRRKRDRMLVEADIMKEQCTNLREERRRLLAENKKLEGLLEEARLAVKASKKTASPASYITAGFSGSLDSLYTAASGLLEMGTERDLPNDDGGMAGKDDAKDECDDEHGVL